jgi:hypothetical protein
LQDDYLPIFTSRNIKSKIEEDDDTTNERTHLSTLNWHLSCELHAEHILCLASFVMMFLLLCIYPLFFGLPFFLLSLSLCVLDGSSSAIVFLTLNVMPVVIIIIIIVIITIVDQR